MPGQYVGSLVAAVFGLIYVQVNTHALPAAVEWPLRLLALVAALAVVAAVYRRRGLSAASPVEGLPSAVPTGSSSWSRSWRFSPGSGCSPARSISPRRE